MSLSGLSHTVVRGIVRAARELDRWPSCKALLRVPPAVTYDRHAFEWIPSNLGREHEQVLREALNGCSVYTPERQILPAIKEAIRHNPAMSESEWLQLMATLRQAITTGLRCTESAPSKEMVQWPDLTVGQLVKGSILVAHPMLVDSVLRRAVVLVADHDEEYGGEFLPAWFIVEVALWSPALT